MPDEDFSDLRDVVDAINRLCENMKTSEEYVSDLLENVEVAEAVETEHSERALVDPGLVVVSEVEIHDSARWHDTSRSVELLDDADSINIQCESDVEIASPESAVRKERWSDTASQVSGCGRLDDAETATSDAEQAPAHCEGPPSEMYYTASSEISLVSESDPPDGAQELEECLSKDERKECVMAGHVAAMRERFESMTRSHTPASDLTRSVSPAVDVCRRATPSPDRLGG